MTSPSAQREWIEMTPRVTTISDVDMSPSAQREWIEMNELISILENAGVSLCTEGVD